MGKMGDTWRGVETSTMTGETDQGVTSNDVYGVNLLEIPMQMGKDRGGTV